MSSGTGDAWDPQPREPVPDRPGGPADVTSGDEVASDGGDDGRLLTAEEVAALLGVTAAWVYEQSRAGRIPTITLGRNRRYRLETIKAWITELERTADRTRSRGAKTAAPPS
jgi:excisionase family DNA binding protein